MINALICCHKTGDVMPLTLQPLLECLFVSQILIADGPSGTAHKASLFVDTPSVQEVVQGIASDKITYQWSKGHSSRSVKNNEILQKVSADCTWILCVDSDEVWRLADLDMLWKFLNSRPAFDRYCILSRNPYPDFFHEFQMPERYGRIYRWFPGAKCQHSDRLHQYVLHDRQKKVSPRQHHWGCAQLPADLRFYHLNALRMEAWGVPQELRRVRLQDDGTVVWRGGKKRHTSDIKPIDRRLIPQVILDLKRDTL